jgi:hypothetical protein
MSIGLALHAQANPPTVSFNIPATGYACGLANGTTKCELPVLVNGQATQMLFDYEARYGNGWVSFWNAPEFDSYAPMVNGGPYSGTFAGYLADGSPYILTVNLVVQYYRGCTSGRLAHCSTYWRAMPGSTISYQ